MWCLWLLLFSKKWLESTCWICVLKRVTSIDMMHLFMKEKSHSNATFVTTGFLKIVIWKHMFHQIMKKKSHTDFTFVATAVLQSVAWRDLLHQFMRGKTFKCEFYDAVYKKSKFENICIESWRNLSNVLFSILWYLFYSKS